MFGFGKKPKIKVEIIGLDGISTSKKAERQLGHVTLRKENKRTEEPEWSPKFKNKNIILERKGRIFKRFIPKLVVYEDGEECIDFNPELKETNIPTWDRRTIERYLKSEAIKRSGEVKIKHELPFIFWLMFMLILVNLMFQFMNMAGFTLG